MIVSVHISINIWRNLDSFIRFTIIFIGKKMIFIKFYFKRIILYCISYKERFYTNGLLACYDNGILCKGAEYNGDY